MRVLVGLIATAAVLCAAESVKNETLSGKLIIVEGQPASLETPAHQRVALDGDAPTRKILGDTRLNGYEVEAKGHFTAPGRFLIDPLHTRAVMVRQDGRLKMITYWCNVCNIRAYTPGPCVCCQRETTLDLRDPGDQ